MKVEELRIGNIVLGVSNRLEVIKEIHYKGGLWIQPLNMDFQCVENIENISGVELTPEILVKAGFINIPHYTVSNSMIFDLGRSRHLSIGCVGTPNELLWMQEIKDGTITDLVCLWNFDYDGKLHLHQLQNIVHAISLNELAITL